MPVKKNKFKCYNRNKHNFFYSLDCQAGVGLINPLLLELKKTPHVEFKFYCKFILKKCININLSFSDAIEFLAIWMEKSPDTLLTQLKGAKLKRFFNRTEYDYEGDQWYFPKLLQVFSTLIEEKHVTATEILDYLFETFNFFSEPDIFVSEIIGYDRLEKCIEESPAVFKQALLLKIYQFVEQNKKNAIDISIGWESQKYLSNKLQEYLVSFITNTLFTYPSRKFLEEVNQPESWSLFSRPNCFKGRDRC